jgi:hypothetical protein
LPWTGFVSGQIGSGKEEWYSLRRLWRLDRRLESRRPGFESGLRLVSGVAHQGKPRLGRGGGRCILVEAGRARRRGSHCRESLGGMVEPGPLDKY